MVSGFVFTCPFRAITRVPSLLNSHSHTLHSYPSTILPITGWLRGRSFGVQRLGVGLEARPFFRTLVLIRSFLFFFLRYFITIALR